MNVVGPVVSGSGNCIAKFVLGKDRRKLSEIDLHLGGMEMLLNGRQVSVGVGAACLGNPLNAVQWLARKMVEEIGRAHV